MEQHAKDIVHHLDGLSDLIVPVLAAILRHAKPDAWPNGGLEIERVPKNWALV